MEQEPSIDVSAQFGGRDAAAAVLPHFKALKRAAIATTLANFPFPQLAFILRVDGEVNQYGLRGPGFIEIDNDSTYVSVDIGITVDDRQVLRKAISGAVKGTLKLLVDHHDQRLKQLDRASLATALQSLCDGYERYLAQP